MINRDDMLELTRRMNIKRTHISRVAGCYVDADGEYDGSFNVHFMKLKPGDMENNLMLAKTVPFSGTNSELVEYSFPGSSKFSKDINKLLWEIKKCRLENDALLDVFYDLIIEQYKPGFAYSIHVFFGAYDIPVKGTDKERYGDSEEVYEYIICTISPLVGEYEPGTPTCGFLYPAFADRSADLDHIDIYEKSGFDLIRFLGIDK